VPRPELSLVIPIYNEEEVLPSLESRLLGMLRDIGETCEIVFVDDGSKDRSIDLLRDMASREPRFRVLSFSRNFGHQRAITAGMDAARGKAIVIMDADLQDPPEVVVEMVAKWREGFDVVYGRRRSRQGETWFKLTTAKIFYRLFAAMIPIEVPLDTGDFRLMSRRVVMVLRGLRESHRFVRGLVAWAGFKQTAVEYDRAARVAGETKYPLRKMISFALDGIASFSTLPLRAATYLGVIVGIGSILYAIVAIITALVGFTVPGWTTTVVLVSFLFSVQLLVTGVLGDYVGRIYEQVKLRPLYVVAEKINFSKKARAAAAERAAAMPPPPKPASIPPKKPPVPPPSSVEELTGSHLIPDESKSTVIGMPAPIPAAGQPAFPAPEAPPAQPKTKTEPMGSRTPASTSTKSKAPVGLPSGRSVPPPMPAPKEAAKPSSTPPPPVKTLIGGSIAADTDPDKKPPSE
jgi:dolichol-phosphate mannosyltransferase